MRLTKKKAIEIAKELWTWLAGTGRRYKEDWDGWEKYGAMESSCPFCEYSYQRGDSLRCDRCPYYIMFGGCENDDTPYSNWKDAKTVEERKKYAQEFLEQLKQLRNKK